MTGRRTAITQLLAKTTLHPWTTDKEALAEEILAAMERTDGPEQSADDRQRIARIEAARSDRYMPLSEDPRLRSYQESNIELSRRICLLTEAAAPFIAVADYYPTREDDHLPVWIDDDRPKIRALTIGHLRDLKAAMSGHVLPERTPAPDALSAIGIEAES